MSDPRRTTRSGTILKRADRVQDRLKARIHQRFLPYEVRMSVVQSGGGVQFVDLLVFDLWTGLDIVKFRVESSRQREFPKNIQLMREWVTSNN